jgi:hypothetical protein
MARLQAQHAGDGNKRDNQRNLPRPWSLTTLNPIVAFCKNSNLRGHDNEFMINDKAVLIAAKNLATVSGSSASGVNQLMINAK